MSSIECVTFEIPRSTLVQREANRRRWERPPADIITLEYHPDPGPHLPLSDVAGIRSFYRQVALHSEGGVVEIDVVPFGGYRAVKTIFKFPQEPTGMTYLGTWGLVFEEEYFAIKVECHEVGTTGQRDTMVALELGVDPSSGSMKRLARRVAGRPLDDWWSDPYEPRYWGPVMRNRSEDRRYDSKFPEHPLTRVRQTLQQIASTVTVDPKLRPLAS